MGNSRIVRAVFFFPLSDERQILNLLPSASLWTHEFSLDHCQPLDHPPPHPPHSQHQYPTYHPGGLFVEVTQSPVTLTFLTRRLKSATLLKVLPKKTRI
ncbi:hypothetical protein CY34DRAFT_806004 [Suillus luteus UH-Slu-Lm8-n1]|uniref:Uncharacterized protein n=1 Tax=Suillus luteus UH-Slu-Lm8-n1 TaxID=930992 RepID=A0A0D0AU60_9AGAM|nr:hypothetical protein CY34DRAFT_806004 [Suillus luteus UH-Slu-Lm8-n1]